MSNGTTRYDAATIEQAVLTLLVEMRALIKVFERKGLLKPGEVSCEILTMRNLAAATIRHRRHREEGETQGGTSIKFLFPSGNTTMRPARGFPATSMRRAEGRSTSAGGPAGCAGRAHAGHRAKANPACV